MDLEEEETDGVMDLPQNANLGRSMDWSWRRKVRCYCREEKKDEKERNGKWVWKGNPIEEQSRDECNGRRSVST